MKASKKTLTTLSAAAAMALGGIAVAQTYDSSTPSTQPAAPLGSSSTMQNTGEPTSPAASADTSTSGAAAATTTTDTDTGLVAQADRN